MSRAPDTMLLAEPSPLCARSGSTGLWVVIPAQDEAASIVEVISRVLEHADHVVVVDDASEDGTAELAARAGAKVLRLVNSLDAWGATQAGLRYALSQGADLVVTLDADGQHPAGCLPRLAAPVLAGTADVVIGSDPSRVSWQRHWAWRYLRAITGLDVSDLTSGYRVYGREVIQCLSGPGASLLNYQDIGVLMMLRASGFRLVEVPVKMGPRWSGKSRVFRSWLKVAAYLLESSVLGLSRFSGRSGPRRAA
jgi:glycosyltransferase involved in cell wall biosynthesis